jgi:quinoprotein glucose dehydrogenase
MKKTCRLALAALLALPCAAAEKKAAPKAALELHKWSGKLNVPDPVAVTTDPQGRVYVSATTRRKVADLDIREHTMWIPDDVSLTSVEEKRSLS